VDAQALIRVFDADGAVCHVSLEDTPYARLLPRVAFLKASSEEAPYVGVETARRRCCVIVTEGRDGCRLFWDGGEARVAPFPAVQVDPTGAGDSFLAGLRPGCCGDFLQRTRRCWGTFLVLPRSRRSACPPSIPRCCRLLKKYLKIRQQNDQVHV